MFSVENVCICFELCFGVNASQKISTNMKLVSVS